MRNFVFITDLHFKASSNTRTGDLLTDLVDKLSWVVGYCNSVDAALLIGGDFFDRPSVQDVVKNRVAPILMKVKNGVYGISGNHDRLYDNPAFNYKTSWVTLTSTGVVKDVDAGDVDFGDVVVSSTVPIVDKGKPCVFIFHGFLNKDDGRNTFRFTDIGEHSNELLVCLGHDHKVYEPLVFDSRTTILRPGSFQRCIRAEESQRQPELVHITVDDGKISYTTVEIECRDWHTIFGTKEASVGEAEVHASYDDVIKQLSCASKSQLSFEEALRSCGSEDVVNYLTKLLGSVKMENSIKRQNL